MSRSRKILIAMLALFLSAVVAREVYAQMRLQQLMIAKLARRL